MVAIILKQGLRVSGSIRFHLRVLKRVRRLKLYLEGCPQSQPMAFASRGRTPLPRKLKVTFGTKNMVRRRFKYLSSVIAHNNPGPSYITAHFADVILSDIRSIKLTPEGLRAINGLLDELLAKILNTSSSLVTHKLRDGLLGLLPTTPGREFLLQAEAKLKAHWQRTEESSAPEDDSLTFNLQWALSVCETPLLLLCSGIMPLLASAGEV